MIGPKYLYFSSFSALVITSLIACSTKSNEKTQSTTLSYRYVLNGCDTGEKKFNDLSGYCDSLVDDAANNYCAQSLRLNEYQVKCPSTTSNKSTETTTVPPQTQEKVPTAEVPEAEQQPQPPIAEAPAGESATLPETVTLSGRFKTRTNIVPKDVGDDSLLITLDGEIIVNLIEPEMNRQLKIDLAEQVQFINFDLQKCELTINQYNNKNFDNKVIGFTMMGLNKKSQIDSSGCMTRLSTLAMTGFTIEFTNVPVGGALSQDIIPKVILQVENQ